MAESSPTESPLGELSRPIATRASESASSPDPARAPSGRDPSTETDTGTEVETRLHPERMWQVIVWDDPINLMSYVTYVLQRLFGYTLEKATQLMLKVHHEGKCIVATVERERGEVIVGKLHAFGLQATLSRFEE